MTPEQINIAIAENCGAKWVRLRGEDDPSRSLMLYGVLEAPIKLADMTEPVVQVHYLPNYYDDLNAMHEAEKTLRNNQLHYVDYYGVLYRVVSGKDIYDGDIGYFGFSLVNATAPQRAEAFLRTIRKWIE